MPRIRQTTVFKFEELSDRAKERARDWFRQGGFDYEWWDTVYDDAKTCLALAGFGVDRIYFTGFWSQGDGACFEGSWSAADAKPVKDMRAHAPKDKELRRIAATMRSIARRFSRASMAVKHTGRYSHEFETSFSVDFGDDPIERMAYKSPRWEARNAKLQAAEEEIIEASRDAMRWIYKCLEREYEWLSSDEQVDESIVANEYEFDENGNRA